MAEDSGNYFQQVIEGFKNLLNHPQFQCKPFHCETHKSSLKKCSRHKCIHEPNINDVVRVCLLSVYSSG